MRGEERVERRRAVLCLGFVFEALGGLETRPWLFVVADGEMWVVAKETLDKLGMNDESDVF